MGATGAIVAISALMTGASAYSQSKAQKSEGAYQAQQFETNSRIANLQADDAIFRGNQDAARHKQQVKKVIGAQRAAMGAQGIEINADSALDVQADTAGLGAIDEATIKNNAFREAWGYRVAGADYASQAEFARLSAANKSRNTILTAGMNIVGDIGTAYSKSKGKTVGSKKAAE